MSGAILTMPDKDFHEYTPERRVEPQQLIIPRWFVGVIITVGTFLLVQHGTAVWWASQLSAKVDANRDLILERTDDRYRNTDAEKDFQAVKFRFERNERRIELLEKAIESNRNRNYPKK